MSERTPAAKAIGVSGVEQFGGMIFQRREYDAAWRGTQRDKTIQSMLNDPLIGAVLFGIEMLVRRVDWTVQAADESDPAIEQAAFVKQALDDMDGYWPGDTLAQVLTFLGWGWSCLEVTYKQRNGGEGSPTSRYDDGRIGWRSWELRPQLTRYGWEFDSDNQVTGLIQEDPVSLRHLTIPLAKCLLFRYAGRDNSPEGMTPLRVAFDAWFYKRQLQRIEAVGVERDLAGLPVYRIPAADIEGNTEAYQTAKTIVSNIRNDSQVGIVLPSDRDEHGNAYHELELLSSGGQRAFDTDVIIRRYANEVVTTFLANVMRAGQDNVGSLALSETQGGLFQQAIGAHLDTIGMTITEQAILPLIRLNGFDEAIAPTLKHGNVEGADLAGLGQYLTQLANAGMLANTPELKAFVHEVAGLPVPTVKELEQMAKEEKAEKAAARDAFVSNLNAGMHDGDYQRDEDQA